MIYIAGKYTGLCNKICKSILKKYHKVLFIETQQFYSHEQDRVVTMFLLKELVYDEEKGKQVKRTLLQTASQIVLVQYLGNLHRELEAEESDATDW